MVLHRKLRIHINPVCVDANIILETFRPRFPTIKHVGIYLLENEVYVCVQNTARMSSNIVSQLFAKLEIDIIDISPYLQIEGELIEEAGITNGRRTNGAVMDNSYHTICVHPSGKESLQHITGEYIQSLLGKKLNLEVFFEFGVKLYSLDQNMNFRARQKYPKVRVKSGTNGWVTLEKKAAFDTLLETLVGQARRAVCKYRDDISIGDVEQFNRQLENLHDYRYSSCPDRRGFYQKFRDNCLTTIASNTKNRIDRLRNWCDKKVKLV
jgi:hypothetical protein